MKKERYNSKSESERDSKVEKVIGVDTGTKNLPGLSNDV